MKLTFIYNANSGAVNTWLDIGHKLLRPDTYSCNLCALTHVILREKDEWTRYKNESQIDIEFLHKDEFETKYNKGYDYPVILASKKDGEFEVMIGPKEINNINDLSDLIAMLPKV